MRFRLLGPMGADGIGPGGAVPGGARLRILLAALVLRADEPVSREALIEALWDGTAPAGAEVTLRGHVRRLRIALGPEAGGRIVAHDPGYLIRLAPTEVDVLEFEALCGQAGNALRAADWEGTSAAGTRALGLWRGEPLLDVHSQVLRGEFVPRLEQLLVQVREDRIEADLQLGRHAQVVQQIRELTAAYPLRERFHAQLMLALARGGRRSEALEAYRRARRVLVEELGVEPGAELRDLHRRVLAGNLEPAAAAARSPTETAPVTPRQLPAAPHRFIGRKTEVDELTRLLDEIGTSGGTVAISAIDGMAGLGKTSLALHTAHRLAEKFPDGQLFLDLHGYTRGRPPRTADEALDWLLRSLGVSAAQIPKDTERASALYRERLTDSRTLIVLDNAATEAQVHPLLPGGGSCLVLITSRRRLRGLDEARTLSLDLLPPPEATALLRAMAGPERIPAEDPELGEVAELCGRLPLALCIAGSLLRHRPAWPLAHLAGLLREQHRRLPTLADGDRDLATVFDLSYAGLDEPHRRLWRRLGLVPGPDLDGDAAAALAETDPASAVRLLEDLVDHNLLIASAPGRYRLHDLVRDFVRTLAETDPDGDDALDRLLRYYAYTARIASIPIARFPRPIPDGPAPAHSPGFADSDAARAWLRAERENLAAAHARAQALDLPVHAVALAAGLAEILRTDGPVARALELHRAAAEIAGRHGLTAARADALTDLGTVQSLADPAGSIVPLTRAAELYRTSGHREGEANALSQLGTVRLLTGDLSGSAAALVRALEIHRETGHRHGAAIALGDLGRVRHAIGDLTAAEDALTEALEIHRESGYRGGVAYTLTELGNVRRDAGDPVGATDALTEALEIHRETGHRQGEAGVLVELGTAKYRSGELAAAADALTYALEHYRTTGSRGNEAWALNRYAAIVAATGDIAGAAALYQQALAMNRELNKPDDEAAALEGLAECHLANGETEAAVSHLRQALEIYRRLDTPLETRRVEARLGDLPAADSAEP